MMVEHSAPWPFSLEDLVQHWRYRPGWEFRLLADLGREDGTHGTTLDITTCGYNAYHPERGHTYRVHHYMHVPAATFNRGAWERWMLDRCLDVERHEACEFAAILDGNDNPAEWKRPFAPTHGPGDDPYSIKEYASVVQRKTRYTGEVKA